MWSAKEKRDNAVAIMRGSIKRDSTGSKLTDAAVERAAQFAADNWTGGAGDAAKAGIAHVVDGILKK